MRFLAQLNEQPTSLELLTKIDRPLNRISSPIYRATLKLILRVCGRALLLSIPNACPFRWGFIRVGPALEAVPAINWYQGGQPVP